MDKCDTKQLYYNKFKTERPEKMRLLKQYFQEFYDSRIQKQYDMGVIIKSHVLLKNNNIKHFLLTNEKEFYDYLPQDNIIDVDWGELSIKYPDDLKSLHTSYEGHLQVFKKIKAVLSSVI